MAYYDYECNKCSHRFTVHETFAEHDKHGPVKCPKCESKDVRQSYATVHVKTSKKS